MKSFQQLSATLALGGDIRNTVVFDRFEPITFPEYLCIIVAHGEAAITDVRDICVPVERTEEEERTRLELKFGKPLVAQCFPGMGMEMPTRSGKFPEAPAPVDPTPEPAPEPAPVDPAPAPVDVAPVDPAVSGGVPPIPKPSKTKG
jgi:hypothetical protein